jgi:hypothetical protein
MRAITALYSLSLCFALVGITSCALLPNHRVTYNQDGAQIGIEDDPTISAKQPEVRNAHPAELTVEQVQSLLSMIQVSGFSGTLVGIFVSPQPMALLSQEELQKYSQPVTDALKAAGPTERVFFSFPKPGGTYSEDRTAGALFLRGRYLHVVLTDHSSILRADTGGDNLRTGPERDTKALKLSVAKPAQPATVPDAEEPKWSPFEKARISLNYGQTLALLKTVPSSRQGRVVERPRPTSGEAGAAEPDVQEQVRELTNSNAQLRERLDDQTRKTKELSEQVDRLRQELEQNKAVKQPPRKNSTP